MPTAQIRIMTISAIIPTILMSLTLLSMIFKSCDFSKSFRESQKPIVFIEAATEFAHANTIPTDAPNSGPRERDMIKYIPPINKLILFLKYTLKQRTLKFFFIKVWNIFKNYLTSIYFALYNFYI